MGATKRGGGSQTNKHFNVKKEKSQKWLCTCKCTSLGFKEHRLGFLLLNSNINPDHKIVQRAFIGDVN